MSFLKLAPMYPSGPPGDDGARLPLWGTQAGSCVLGPAVLTQTIHKPQRGMRVHLFFRSLLPTNKLLVTPSPVSSTLGKPPPPATSDAPTNLEAAGGHQGPVCLLLGSVFRFRGLGLGGHRTGDGADPQRPMWGGRATVGRVVPGFAPQILQLLPLGTFDCIHGE